MLLEHYSYPIYRKNNHAFHTCNALKSIYNISLCSNTQGTSNSSPPPALSNNATTSPPMAANCVLTSIQVLPDEAKRNDGFESVAVPPPESDTNESTTDDAVHVVKNSLKREKINYSSNDFSLSSHNFLNYVGSICQSSVNLSHTSCS